MHHVAVVAVARDEGPYIHEWIHHHLYFKFEKIFIGLNRTSDSSASIVTQIQHAYPNVYLHDMDWIDKSNHGKPNSQIQSISYAFLTDLICREHTDITDILYVDIDEFWFPANFQAPIWRWLSRVETYDVMSFNWVVQNADDNAFEAPFVNKNVTINSHVKSLVNIDALQKISAFRCHVPVFEEGTLHTDSRGKPVPENKIGRQLNHKIPSNLETVAFVLHRTMRSEREYLYSLMRQNPEVESPLKDNRYGFLHSFTETLCLPEKQQRRYYRSLNRFIKKTMIASAIEESRQQLIKRSDRILDVDDVTMIQFFRLYDETLKGCRVHAELLDRIANSKVPRSIDVEVSEDDLRKIAQNLKYTKARYPQLSGYFKDYMDLIDAGYT